MSFKTKAKGVRHAGFTGASENRRSANRELAFHAEVVPEIRNPILRPSFMAVIEYRGTEGVYEFV